MSLLDKEFQYYLSHQGELVKKYIDKYIVIKGEKVIGTYDSQLEAYNHSIKEHEIGTFLIQHCLPGNDSHTQTFHSRVLVNHI